MTYGFELGDGAHTLDQQAELDWLRGYQVVDAAGGSNLVSTGGTANLVIQAAAGDINFGGTTVTCTQDPLDVSAAVDPDDPRKLTVYRDGNGDLQYSAGTPAPAEPSGATQRNAHTPSPPPLTTTDAVVLATVWLDAGASAVNSGDIRDRRMPAELDVGSIDTEEATINDDIDQSRSGVTSFQRLRSMSPGNTDDSNVIEGAQETLGVSTSTTEIYSTDVVNKRAQMVLVYGREAPPVYFADLLLILAGLGITVYETQGRNSPASRSYSTSNQNLEVAMGSGTYNIVAVGTTADISEP